MVTVVTGEISQQEGLREALELVRESKDVKNGLLRIVSKEVSGKLGIFCSRYITGAQIASSGETGYAAVKKLLSVRQGMFAYVQADMAEDSALKQSLGLDINMLLEWAETNADDEISLEAAVDSIPKGGNDSLFLMNEDDLSESSIAPASEAVEMLKSTFAGSSGGNGKSGIEDTQDNEEPSVSLDSLLVSEEVESASKVEAKKDSLESLLEDKKQEETTQSNEDQVMSAPAASKSEKALLDLLLDDEDEKVTAKADKVNLIGREESAEVQVEAKAESTSAKTDEEKLEQTQEGDVLTESVDTIGGLDAVLADVRHEIANQTANEEQSEEEQVEEQEPAAKEKDEPVEEKADTQEEPAEETAEEVVRSEEEAPDAAIDEPTWSVEPGAEEKSEDEDTFDATPEEEKPKAPTPPPVPVAPPPIDWGDEDPANPEMPSKISGNVLSKLGSGLGSRDSDSADSSTKVEDEPKLPAIPSLPKVPAHLDEMQAEKVFSDLERSILRSSLPEGQGYTPNQLDSIPTPKAKAGGFSPSDLDAIPTPGANIAGDYGMAGKKPTKEESKAGIEAREYFQSESQKLSAVDPKQFLSQTGTFKKLSASELKGATEDTNPNVTIAAAVAAFIIGGFILFFGLTLLSSNPVKQHMTKGIAYLDSGKADLAIKEFNEVIAAEPKNNNAILKRAAAFMETSDFDKAIEDYTRVLGTDKKNIVALLGRGTAYMRSRLYGDAVEDLTGVIKASPDMAEPYKLRATAYLQEEEYQEALKDLEKVIKLGSSKDLYEIYCTKGSIYSKMDDHKKASSEFGRALGLDPRPERAYLGRANEYLLLGQARQAIADCDSLLKLMPGLGRAYYIRGLGYKALGETSHARDDFDKAINANASLVEAYVDRGKLHASQKNWRSAVSDFEEALKLKPNLPDVPDALKKAKANAPKSVPLRLIDPDLAPASAQEPKTNNLNELISIGRKQLRSNPSLAILALNKATRLYPSDISARRNLAYALLNCGRPAEAAGHFAALVSAQGAPSDRLALANSYLSANYIEQAISTYEQMVNDLDSQDARLGLATAYAKAGFFEKCKMICREAIAKSRSHQETATFEAIARNPGAAGGGGGAAIPGGSYGQRQLQAPPSGPVGD